MTIINIIKNNEGFTLIELLTAIAVFGLVISTLYTVLIFGFNIYNQGSEQANIQQTSRLIKDIIDNNVRYAKYIKINDSNDSNEIGSPNENNVILELSDESKAPYALKLNGRKITDKIFNRMKLVNNDQENELPLIEIEFEFKNDQTITFQTLLYNLSN